jgi:hypothetical protein
MRLIPKTSAIFRASATLAAVLALGGGFAWAQATAPAPAAAAAAAQKATIDASEAWTRATPGGAANAAVYLRIVNAGKDADTLNGVETENAKRAVVHTTTNNGGVARMNMVASLPIPRASTVTLAPGGSHVMLEGLKVPLRQGESFIITLVFAKAGKISTTVKVVSVSATGPGPETAAAATPAPPAPAQPKPNPTDR